jgi:superfamily II DNA or RNA helicase
VVKAPPRSGKTYIAAVGICRIGQKALILAHQREWLKNFRETFVGSDTQDPMTTAKEGQVGFCKSYEDFRDTDICLATFQQFMNKSGRKLLARIQSMFTVLVVDECHQAAATETSRVLARINSKYKWGLSGTPERKDEKYVIAENLLGKVLYEAKVERLRPRVQAIFTGIEFKMSNSQVGFTYLVNRMENHKVRKERVVKEAIRLAREGHLVMIPLARVRSIKEYVRLINEEAEAKWARAFYGGTGAVYKAKREKLIDDARNYKFKIIVGNISLLSTGLNIPRASAIIDRVTPTSNIPKAQQRLSRILTPWEDKPEPLVVLMLDNGDTMRNMARNEFWNVLYKMKPKIDDLTYKSLLAHFANKTSNFENLRDAV